MKTFLIYSMLATLTAACGIGLWRIRSLERPYLFLLVQLITALIVEISAKYFVAVNTSLYNVYILQELIWLGLVGRLLLKDNFFRNLVPIGLLICIGVWCVNMHAIRNQVAFANKAFLSNCILIAGLFTGIMLQTASRSQQILRHPLFWLCLSHILYFGCVIPYFSLYDYFTNENVKLGTKLFVINDVVAIIRYALIAYVLLQQGRWFEEAARADPLSKIERKTK